MRVAFLIACYVIITLLSILNPMTAVLYYTGISIIRPEMLTWGGTAIKHLFPISMATIIFSTYSRGRFSLTRVFDFQFASFMLFIITLIVSTYVSSYENIDSGKYNKILLLIFAMCVLLKMNLIEMNLIRKYYKYTVAFLAFIGLWGAQQWLHGNPDMEGLFGSFVKDRCGICAIFILYYPVALFFAIKSRSFTERLFGIAASLLFLADIVFTNSRAGFIGMSLSALFLMRFVKRKFALLICLVPALLIVLTILPEKYIQRVNMLTDKHIADTENPLDGSAAGRLVVWQGGLRVFMQNPLIGVGTMNSPEAIWLMGDEFSGKIDPELWKYLFASPELRLAIHNTFIEVFAEGGIIGALGFYLFILTSMIRGMEVSRYRGGNEELGEIVILYRCVKAGLLGYCVAAFFANMRYVDFFYWQLIILPVIAAQGLKMAGQVPASDPKKTIPHLAPLSPPLKGADATCR